MLLRKLRLNPATFAVYLLLAILAPAFAVIPNAMAETASTAGTAPTAKTAPANGDSTLMLGEVQVTGTKTGPLPARSVLTSVDILGADKIEKQNVMNSWQLFSLLPGIQLTEYNMGTVSGKLSFRGFNGEGEINAVKLLIDGVPSNTNDGNMPYLDIIFPLEIQALEEVRGTNDPRYGLHNIAGNVNVVTKQGGNYNQTRVRYGSFNTREAQVAMGIEKEGGFSQNYFAAWQGSDGYRSHAQSKKYSLAGKWFYTPESQNYAAGLIARLYSHDADEAGYLTYDESRANPEQSMTRNATDGDKRRMDQITAHFNSGLSDRVNLSVKAYINHFNDTRWVTFYTAQQERFGDERHVGALATLTWRPEVSSLHDLAVEGGLSVERQDNRSERYSTTAQVRTKQTRNQQFNFDTNGGYMQVIIQPTATLKLTPAYRVDQVGGDYTNQLDSKNYPVNNYGLIHQPKFSVVYTPVDAYSLYGNWGRTFQVGVGTASYKVKQANDLQASINEGWELGVKFQPVKQLNGRIAAWTQIADNEARRKLGDAANDSENIGKTERRGLDLQVNVAPSEATAVWLAYSWQSSKILRADAAVPASQDKEIDHVPNYIVSGGAEYEAAPHLKLALTAHGQGDSYLERTNATGKYGYHLLYNVSVAYQWSDKISLDFQVRNLTGSYYEYVWDDGTRTLHAPGDGRAYYVAINLAL